MTTEHKPHTEPWTLERALEVAGAADQETLSVEEAHALRWLTQNAYDLGLQLLALKEQHDTLLVHYEHLKTHLETCPAAGLKEQLTASESRADAAVAEAAAPDKCGVCGGLECVCGVPDHLRRYIDNWLTVNKKQSNEVRWGNFPLGMVQTWINVGQDVTELQRQLQAAEERDRIADRLLIDNQRLREYATELEHRLRDLGEKV